MCNPYLCWELVIKSWDSLLKSIKKQPKKTKKTTIKIVMETDYMGVVYYFIYSNGDVVKATKKYADAVEIMEKVKANVKLGMPKTEVIDSINF